MLFEKPGESAADLRAIGARAAAKVGAAGNAGDADSRAYLRLRRRRIPITPVTSSEIAIIDAMITSQRTPPSMVLDPIAVARRCR